MQMCRFAILLPSVADFHGGNGDSRLCGSGLRVENLRYDREGQRVIFNQCKVFSSDFTSGACDYGLFLCGQYRFFLLNMNHPAVYLVSFVLSFIGAAIASAAAILSYLSRKAADLQEESDLTI